MRGEVDSHLVRRMLLTGCQRRVTQAEGEAMAKKVHAAFVESSAKDNKNVGECFNHCLI